MFEYFPNEPLTPLSSYLILLQKVEELSRVATCAIDVQRVKLLNSQANSKIMKRPGDVRESLMKFILSDLISKLEKYALHQERLWLLLHLLRS